jgi:hypothetical protein
VDPAFVQSLSPSLPAAQTIRRLESLHMALSIL